MDRASNLLRSVPVWMILITGIAMRLVASLRGYNFDVESYRVVADIVSAGGNVYQETTRYNYGPIWLNLLHWLDSIPFTAPGELVALRYKVTVFLILVDVGIFLYLKKHHSSFIALLFFLNPVSILITGFHSQFDNLAVLIGMISVVNFDGATGRRRLACLIGLGLSLSVKHILFMFPVWLAFKQPTFREKLYVVIVPVAVFLGAFVFYLPEGKDGIIANVFLYKSFNNAPFWSVVAPNLLATVVPKLFLFIGAMALLGLYLEKKSTIESLYLYLISLVVFSSAVANQYLAIPVASMAVNWNVFYLFYSGFAVLYLFHDVDGLSFGLLKTLTHWSGQGGHHLLCILLAAGLATTVLGKQKTQIFFGKVRELAHILLRRLIGQLSTKW